MVGLGLTPPEGSSCGVSERQVYTYTGGAYNALFLLVVVVK